MQGYRYCELLLALTIALDHLTLGRTHLPLSQTEGDGHERSGMRLHLTDAHLERARLRAWVLGDLDGAREDVAAEKTLVEETGYLRRAPEVEVLEGWLEGRGPATG